MFIKAMTAKEIWDLENWGIKDDAIFRVITHLYTLGHT